MRPRPRRADPHMLAGAYALDALTGKDAAAFERHLGTCDACRQEARGFREAAAGLGRAAAVTPPPGLRQDVLAGVRRTRQTPPATWAAREGPAPHGGGLWRGVHPMAPRLAVAIAGAGMLAALVLGGLVVSEHHRLGQEQAHSRQIAAVLNAPDATMMTAHVRTGGSATVVMSHAEHALVLTTVRLRALPASRAYEVWLMGPGGTRSVGMLPAQHGGMTAPVVVTGLAAGDRVGLTVEPEAGARRPTTAPVLLLTLPS